MHFSFTYKIILVLFDYLKKINKIKGRVQIEVIVGNQKIERLGPCGQSDCLLCGGSCKPSAFNHNLPP